MFIYASAASRFVIASRHDPEPEPAPLLEVKLLARHRPQGVAPRHRGPLLTSHLFDLAFQRGGTWRMKVSSQAAMLARDEWSVYY